MKEREYLIKALNDKALKPRYCMEDIDYININDLKTIFLACRKKRL